jgi:hypothetical protein
MPQYPDEFASLNPQDFSDFNQNQLNPFSDYQGEDFLNLPDNVDFAAEEKVGGLTGVPPTGGESFYKNIAEDIDQKTLDNLAREIIEGVEDDIESRRKWESSIETIIKYLGWEVDSIEFKEKLCGAYDNTLSITLMNFFAVIKGEMLPPNGPAKAIAQGEANEFQVMLAEKLATFFNHALTVIDRGYYPDKERMILYVGLFGIGFTKVFQDPLTKEIRSRFIKPQDLIINNECTSLLESTRITQVMQMTKKEVLLKERDGIYLLDVTKYSNEDDMEHSEINQLIDDIDGIVKYNSDNNKDRTLLDFYEAHVELAPSRLMDTVGYNSANDRDSIDNIPRPYIVDLCKSTKKIASIRRNWKPEDNNFKRIECFVKWNFMPGLGMYGNGLGQLMGSNTIVLTNTLRQTVDSITFGNFPGGFIRKGCTPDENNITVHPGQFIPTDTDDKPTSEVYSALPFPPPSTVGLQLISQIKGDTAMLGGAAQQASPVGSSEAPVGTTLANIEIADRFPSNILQSFISSFNYELELIRDNYKEYFNEPYVFDVPGKTYQIQREDFEQNINIVSIADPNLSTKSQRILINELVIRIARENPGTIDLKEAVKRLIKSINVEDIDKLMPPPENIMPMDPISENMSMMSGKGAKASIEQDHESHLTVHAPLMQMLAQDQTKQGELSVLKAHMAEHQAFAYLLQMQMTMGMQMPDPQMLMDPQVQNQIAMQAAQALQQQQQQQQAANPPPPSPTAVMMEDIKQKRESALLKHQEAELRAETEAFKVQTEFESDQLKIEADKEMAKEKNETSMAIEGMKNRK